MKLSLKTIILAAVTAFVFTGISYAAPFKTIEGTIQGANCVIHKHPCPLNAGDPHIALEREFVLLTGSGAYYYLPNLTRSVKSKYLNTKVKVTGDLNGNTLLVSNIDAKINGKYQSVWNWEAIVKNITQGN